eukprot:RCo004510
MERWDKLHPPKDGALPPDVVARVISPVELRKHCTERDLWMSVRGLVYNVTAFQTFHPGGTKVLLEHAGEDATELFDANHSWVRAEVVLRDFVVGSLGGSAQPTPSPPPRSSPTPALFPAFQPGSAGRQATASPAL